MDNETDCFVSGTLGTALRLSRFGCIAPLRFVKKRNGWQISVSRKWSYYGYFIITIIIISTAVALISEMMMEQKNTVHMRSNKSSLVWTLQVILMVLIGGSAALGAPQQMRNMIVSLNQLQKINLELNINHWPTVLEGKTTWLFIFWAIAVLMFSVFDNVISIFNSKNFRLELESHPTQSTTISVLYSLYYCSYWILQLREMQFIMITLHVKFSFTAINNSLRSMLHELEELAVTKANKIYKICCNNYVSPFPAGKTYFGTNTRTKLSSHEEIHHLALVYASTCDVVRDVDRSHGCMVLMMLSSFFLHLICTPYHCITNLISYTEESPFHVMYVGMELIWCFFHTFNLVMIVEPCHETHKEMQMTRELLGHLLRYASSIYDPLAEELEVFFRHIMLNEVSYKPLKVTTMSRALLLTILGSITTYLVIIIQL